MVGSVERRLIFWENRQDRTTGWVVPARLYLFGRGKVSVGSRFFWGIGEMTAGIRDTPTTLAEAKLESSLRRANL